MAKHKIKWSIEARIDLIDILDFYIKRNGNVLYSKKVRTLLQHSIFQISQNPYIGLATDYETVRVYLSLDYQIIYEIFESDILIIMIWDCRRNPDDKRIGTRIK